MDALARWDRTVELSGLSSGESPELGDHEIIRFRRSTRLFLAGDLAIFGWFWNGQAERHPVCGRSSRGFDVRHYYVQHTRWLHLPRYGSWDRDEKVPSWQFRAIKERSERYRQRTVVEVLELPGELRVLRANHPDVRRYVAERLCAADSALPVGAGSGDFSGGSS